MIPEAEDDCHFAVHTVICGNITGGPSEPVIVVRTTPEQTTPVLTSTVTSTSTSDGMYMIDVHVSLS